MDEQLARAGRALAESLLRQHASNAPVAPVNEPPLQVHELVSVTAKLVSRLGEQRDEIAALRAAVKAIEARLPPNIRRVA